MNVKISSTEYYLPDSVITNEYLNRTAGIDLGFLENKVGIKKRHIAEENETTSDMAVKAGLKLIKEHLINPLTIDMLVLCTQNPDFRLPTTACIVQNRLGIKNSCIAFDINLGCSGYIYSLMTACNYIKAGTARNALIIMADQYSKIIDYNDKNTAALFGDAASASFLVPCDDSSGVLDFDFGTDGSNADKLIAYNSGVARNPERGKFIFMDGREIFRFSVQEIPASVNKVLVRNKLDVSDIRFFIFHQANRYILGEIGNRLNIPDEKLIIDVADYGNTVSSTIPIALKNIEDRGLINKEDLLILCGFGVGLSWGTILYRY